MLRFGAVFDRNGAETIENGAETIEIGANAIENGRRDCQIAKIARPRSFRRRSDRKRCQNEAFEFDSNCQAPQKAWQFESNSNAKV